MGTIKALLKNNIFILALALAVMCVFLTYATKYFATMRNFTTILQQMSINGLLATGMTMCIITAGINLSVGSVLSLCGIIVAIALRMGISPILSVVIAMCVGCICGLFNGFFVTRGKMPPFIVTLGMQSIAAGVALMLTNGRPISGVSSSIVVLGAGRFGSIPVSFLIMAFFFILIHILMTHTRPGRYMYTIGGNEEAARLVGINLNVYRALPFVLSGLLCAVAAVIMTGKLNSAEPTAGAGLELDAIAASVIGGTSMSGGEGKIVGTFLGALIMSVIRNGMIQLGVGTYPQQIVIGVIIISVVLVDMMNRQLKS
jgi:ribose transport system permease protein